MTFSTCDEGRLKRSAAVVVVCALLLGASACGGGSGSSGGEKDLTPDAGPDVVDDADAGEIEEPDATPDVDGGDADTDTDTGDETSEEDRDGDGLLNEEDNCPDEANEDQADRDRDGTGDACDHYPFVHTEGNPDDLEVRQEDETNNPNDSVEDARGSYEVTSLPLVVDGNVKPPESSDEGDRDFYPFKIDQPSAILIRMEAKTSSIWVGGVLFGYQARNANVRRVMLGQETGNPEMREAFLAAPGEYGIAASDARNLLTNSSAVGGESHNYRLKVSAIPLPEAESVDSVPAGPISHSYDGKLYTYKVDTSELDGLSATASGVAAGQNSFHNPSLVFYSPQEERVLALNSPGEVNIDTRKTSLTAKLNNRDEVLVIEDYTSRFGSTSSAIQFQKPTNESGDTISVDSEFETVQQPEDERFSKLVWMQPGQSVEGRINAPRASGNNSLEADRDYYLMSVNPGDAVRVVLEPKEESQLQAELKLGYYVSSTGQESSWTREQLLHEVESADQPGQSRAIEFYFEGATAGEIAIRVRHAPNLNNASPEGGANYGYDLRVEKWTPEPIELTEDSSSSDPMTPTTLTGSTKIEPGKLGLFKFTAQPGEVWTVESTEPGRLFAVNRLTRTSDWAEISRKLDEQITLAAIKGGEFWYDVRDYSGGGTGDQEIDVTAEKQPIGEVSSLPYTDDGTIEDDGTSAYYKASVEAGDKIDFRVQTTEIDPTIRIFDLENFEEIVTSSSGEAVRHFEEATDLLIQIEPDDPGSFTFGMQRIEPKPLGDGTLPASDTDLLDNPPFPDWYKVTVEQGQSYLARLAEVGDTDLEARVAAYESSDLDRIKSTSRGRLRFEAPADGDVWIAVYDDAQRGQGSYEFDLEMSELNTQAISLGQTTSGTLQDAEDEIVYTFDADVGAADVEVQASGDWTPKVEFLNGDDYSRINDAEVVEQTVRWAESEARSYAVVVSVGEENGSSAFDFDVTPRVVEQSSSSQETEPNNTDADAQAIGTPPVVYTGDIGNGDDEYDRFDVELSAGDRIWALVAPRNASIGNDPRSRLRLYDPSNSRIESDRRSGVGYYPALYGVEAPTDGTYTLRYEVIFSQYSADYALYIFVDNQ